jgi:hypothetical protein
MSRRALVIGISAYPPPIVKLEAASDEATRWSDLLQKTYRFDDIVVMLDGNATHSNVVNDLRNRLLDGVTAGDEVLLFFSGHGCRVTPADGSQPQEALFLYPEFDAQGHPRTATLTAREFSDIVLEKNVPANAHLEVILDTCFAAAFGMSHGRKDLFLAFDGGDDQNFRTAARFGLLEGHGLDGGSGPAIIVAATGQRQAAFQSPTSPPRMVFSMLALDELAKTPADTYRELITNISKKAQALSQSPDLYGNLSREGDEFASGPLAVLSQVSNAFRTSRQSLTTSLVSRTLSVRIAGTCCFVDRATPANPFVKRLVLPFDDIGSGPLDTHIPFIEVPDAHIVPGSDVSFLSGPYSHKEKIYDDNVLSGHTVSIPYIDTSVALMASSAFANHVPKMTAVTPELFPYPRAEVFASAPQAGLIAGFFDISYGVLDVGPLYEFITHFRRIVTGAETVTYQTPESVQLLIPLLIPSGTPLTIQVSKGASVLEIKLDDSADSITIGNEIEADILGLGSGDDVTHHFGLYYNLASPPPPPDRAVPAKTAEPINSCTVTTWP